MRRRDQLDAEFADFMTARRDQLYRSAYLLTTSPTAAEDLVQTALTKTYVAWSRVRGTDDPVAYVHRMLINSFLSDRRRRSSTELPVAETPDAGGAAGDPAERLALMQALATLPTIDRAVVVLRYWDDRTVADTAQDLGLTEAAVKNRSLRALRALRDLLSDSTLPKGAR